MLLIKFLYKLPNSKFLQNCINQLQQMNLTLDELVSQAFVSGELTCAYFFLFFFQDFHVLRSLRRHNYSPEYCSLKVCLTVVMGALVVVILWTRHGSQMKQGKQSFVFPVYATPSNVTWRDDVPLNNNNPLRRSLMAENSEISNYISEVRPVLKHMYMISLIGTVLSLELYT